jgi:hypothetical protein
MRQSSFVTMLPLPYPCRDTLMPNTASTSYENSARAGARTSTTIARTHARAYAKPRTRAIVHKSSSRFTHAPDHAIKHRHTDTRTRLYEGHRHIRQVLLEPRLRAHTPNR